MLGGLAQQTPSAMPRKPQAVSIRCGYKSCRATRKDCKNTKWTLSLADANKQHCRALRAHAKLVHFCSEAHMLVCQGSSKLQKPRGGREPLSAEQVGALFWAMVSFSPWAAVMALLHTFIGERADCVRQVRADWFIDLDDSDALPRMRIPAVNRKTKAREIPLHKGFATVLWAWISGEPLRGDRGQWPFEGHNLGKAIKNKEKCLLFPGRVRGGSSKRN